ASSGGLPRDLRALPEGGYRPDLYCGRHRLRTKNHPVANPHPSFRPWIAPKTVVTTWVDLSLDGPGGFRPGEIFRRSGGVLGKLEILRPEAAPASSAPLHSAGCLDCPRSIHLGPDR